MNLVRNLATAFENSFHDDTFSLSDVIHLKIQKLVTSL